MKHYCTGIEPNDVAAESATVAADSVITANTVSVYRSSTSGSTRVVAAEAKATVIVLQSCDTVAQWSSYMRLAEAVTAVSLQ